MSDSGFSANMVVPNLNTTQTLSIMGMTFAVSGAIAGLAYLHQQPLPSVTVAKVTETVKADASGVVTASKSTMTTTMVQPDK